MKRIPFVLSTILLMLVAVMFYSVPLVPQIARADDAEIAKLQAEINKLNEARQLSVSATKPLEGQLQNLKTQLQQIQNNILSLSQKIVKKEADLNARTQKIAEQQALLETRVRSYYIRSFLNSPLAVIFSNDSAGGILRELSYRAATTREDQKVITSITQEITDLLVQKEGLEKDKKSLASLQVEVDKNADFLGGEIDKAREFQQNLSTKIAELNAKQQAILAAKSGNFVTSVGDVPLADDANSRPTFDPGFRPAFAPFSFGAYTHRNGMSQYGAKGRADAGQSAEDILKAYYPQSNLNSIA